MGPRASDCPRRAIKPRANAPPIWGPFAGRFDRRIVADAIFVDPGIGTDDSDHQSRNLLRWSDLSDVMKMRGWADRADSAAWVTPLAAGGPRLGNSVGEHFWTMS